MGLRGFVDWGGRKVGDAASEIPGVGFYAFIQLIGQTTMTGRARGCLHGLLSRLEEEGTEAVFTGLEMLCRLRAGD